MTLSLRLAALPLALVLAAPGLKAQQINFLTPTWVDLPNVEQEYSQWDIFYANPATPRDSGFRVTYQWPMYPDLAAPNETNNLYFDPDQNGYEYYADPSNPTVTQVGNPSAWVLSSGNIYLPGLPATAFQIDDETPYTLGTVMLQYVSLGQFPDFGSCVLRYDNGSGTMVELFPVGQEALQLGGSGSTFGGSALLYAYQWDLTGLGVREYQISIAMSDSSVSTTDLILDTAETYSPQLAEESYLTWLVKTFPWFEIDPSGAGAPEADADGDGLNTVAEYVFGRDPFVYDVEPFSLGIAPRNGGNRLFLRYDRPRSRNEETRLTMGGLHRLNLNAGGTILPDDPAPMNLGNGWERVTLWSPHIVGSPSVPGGLEFLSFRATLSN